MFAYQFFHYINDSNDMTTTSDNSTRSDIKPDQNILANHDICRFYAPCTKPPKNDDEIVPQMNLVNTC